MKTTEYNKAITNAMNRAKKHFDGECILTATQPVDGAHILPRSTYPHLASVQYNIVPLCRRLHHTMDSLPRAADRINFLHQHVNPEHRAKLEGWLVELLKTIAEAA